MPGLNPSSLKIRLCNFLFGNPKKKKIIIIIAVLLVVLVSAVVAKDYVIKLVTTTTASKIIGAPVHIGNFSMDTFRHSISIKDFMIYNPEGFPRGIFVDLPRVDINYDFPSLLKGKVHLTFADIEVKEIGLIKNGEGRLNVDALKVARGKEPNTEKKEQIKDIAMQIDILNLQIGRIVSKDYSKGKEPVVKVYDINLKKSYKNVTGARQLAGIVLTEPLKAAGIKGAKIYGAALLTGVGIVPLAVTSVFIGKDSVKQTIDISAGKLYDISQQVLNRIGKVKKEDKDDGLIIAEVNGAKITVKIKEETSGTSRITVSARKYMLPRPEIANGVLYQINEGVK